MKNPIMKKQQTSAERIQWELNYNEMLAKISSEPLPRVHAHAKNIDEYFLRWLGFCRLETKNLQSLTENNLFVVVEAASNVAHLDVSRLPEQEKIQVWKAWEDYQKSLAGLKSCLQTIKSEAEHSYIKFKLFADIVRKLPHEYESTNPAPKR